MSGLLRLETNRTIVNISRTAGVPEQNMHHYISESPWPGAGVIAQVRNEIAQHPYFAHESLLFLDKNADDKAGQSSAGEGRQYNGPLGKVDVCQVGVFLALAKDGLSCRIDGELFLPESWFDDDHTALRERVGVPQERTFRTKPELGWQLIVRAQQDGVPFRAPVCDELYGRSIAIRRQMHEAASE